MRRRFTASSWQESRVPPRPVVIDAASGTPPPLGERMTRLATARQAPSQGLVLKACIFATGLAGIVAEYVMATLASYLLGDVVLQ